ncbi:response regulator [Flavobacterium sp. 3HN19-14]|uniref:response regulator n=1 Tax=Flavobacterium sp. 3HN19-14 TaxID=3448133 RepID=UPI003EE0EFFF
MAESLHIIIAEDDIDDGEIIKESFEKHPAFAKVDVVANGKELLEFLRKDGSKPDVILTDINMPIINGIEALKEISTHPELRKIAAFAYSTTINPIYEAKCMEFGTKGFLIKPFTLQEFYQIPDKVMAILKQA